MNFNLPDYKYSLDVTVDCFVEEDNNGEIFNGICKTVIERLSKGVNREIPLSEIFNEIPVVRMDKSKCK